MACHLRITKVEAHTVKGLFTCKGGDFQWVQVPPGNGSLQPEARKVKKLERAFVR